MTTMPYLPAYFDLEAPDRLRVLKLYARAETDLRTAIQMSQELRRANEAKNRNSERRIYTTFDDPKRFDRIAHEAMVLQDTIEVYVAGVTTS